MEDITIIEFGFLESGKSEEERESGFQDIGKLSAIILIEEDKLSTNSLLKLHAS